MPKIKGKLKVYAVGAGTMFAPCYTVRMDLGAGDILYHILSVYAGGGELKYTLQPLQGCTKSIHRKYKIGAHSKLAKCANATMLKQVRLAYEWTSNWMQIPRNLDSVGIAPFVRLAAQEGMSRNFFTKVANYTKDKVLPSIYGYDVGVIYL